MCFYNTVMIPKDADIEQKQITKSFSEISNKKVLYQYTLV